LVGTTAGQIATWNGTGWVASAPVSADNSLLWYFMG
jgi:hypothetical protein